MKVLIVVYLIAWPLITYDLFKNENPRTAIQVILNVALGGFLASMITLLFAVGYVAAYALDKAT